MKPKAFDYMRANSVDEAVAGLAKTGEGARILAGGQSMVPILNFRLADPELLIDISRIKELDYIKIDGNAVQIGAATRQAKVMAWPELADRIPLLAKALPHVGHFQTRSRGTICGSLAHADPSSEIPLCLAMLDGEVILKSASGERRLAAADFQTGMLSTAKRDDEMLVAARFPIAEAGTGYAFDEMAQRRGDFAIVAVAATVSASKIRLGVGGVADKPTIVEWGNIAGDELDDALNAFAWELGGYDDVHATARYRRELVRRLGRRVIEEART